MCLFHFATPHRRQGHVRMDMKVIASRGGNRRLFWCVMTSFNICFPTDGDITGNSSYRLLELSPDLVKLIESGDLPPGSLTIKGRRSDDAVFCTPSSTYAIRSIAVSNTVAVVTSPNQSSPKKQFVPSTPVGSVPSIGEHDLVIRDQLHEYLELVPILPRLEQLDSLLRGAEYDGNGVGNQDGGPRRPVCDHIHCQDWST